MSSRQVTGCKLDMHRFQVSRRYGNPVDLWNGMSQAQPEHDPIFEDFLQFLAAIFESLARGPNAWAGGDFAVVRFGVLNDFVMGVPHGSQDVRGEHAFILA